MCNFSKKNFFSHFVCIKQIYVFSVLKLFDALIRSNKIQIWRDIQKVKNINKKQRNENNKKKKQNIRTLKQFPSHYLWMYENVMCISAQRWQITLRINECLCVSVIYEFSVSRRRNHLYLFVKSINLCVYVCLAICVLHLLQPDILYVNLQTKECKWQSKLQTQK